MTEAPPDYSAELRFKKITLRNFLKPDPILKHFTPWGLADGTVRPIAIKERIGSILRIRLRDEVPLEVRRIFEVAKAALIYGHYFYPLFSLGHDHIWRVAEAALTHKCEELKAPKLSGMQRKIDWLLSRGALPQNQKDRWNLLCRMRNHASHNPVQTISAPPMVLNGFSSLVEDINGLFHSR